MMEHRFSRQFRSARTNEVDVRPIYCFGLEGHWSLEPGSEASASASRSCGRHDAGASIRGRGSRSNPHRRGTETCHIAVVDAGFSATLPPSITGSPYGEIEDQSRSHCCTARSCSSLIALLRPATARIEYYGGSAARIPIDVQVSMDDRWADRALAASASRSLHDDVAVAGAMQLAAQSAAARGWRRETLSELVSRHVCSERPHLVGSTRRCSPLADGRPPSALLHDHNVAVIAAAGQRHAGSRPSAEAIAPAVLSRHVIAMTSLRSVQPIDSGRPNHVEPRRALLRRSRPGGMYTAPGIDLISASVRRGRTAHGGSALVRLVIRRGGSNRVFRGWAIRSLMSPTRTFPI